MKSRAVLAFASKTVVLALLLFATQAVTSVLLGVATPSGKSPALGPLFVSYLAQAGVLSHFVLRSPWRGWKLYTAVFLLFFGITTALTQVETLVFLRRLVGIVPEGMVSLLFLQGLLTSSIFSFWVVLVYGRFGRKMESLQGVPRAPKSWGLGRPILLALLYVLFYVSFGFLVFRPLAGEAFQEFYGGLASQASPLLVVPLQILRGLVFAILALLVVRATEARRSEKSLLVALLFAVLMGFLLLPPNPYMPDRIRLSHFVEVTTSNFLFGWLAGRLLSD